MSINGYAVDYSWDKDGLPLQIGQQSLSYLRGTALLSEREVGSARVTYTYSDFGELDDLRVRAGGELFRVRYTRDDLGRITEARETNQGTTTTWVVRRCYEDGVITLVVGGPTLDDRGGSLRCADFEVDLSDQVDQT